MANSPKTMEIATACSKPRNDGYIKFSHTNFTLRLRFFKSFLKFVGSIDVKCTN